MVAGLRGSTYEDKCREVGLQTLAERRAQQDLILAHRFIGGDIDCNGMFLKTNHNERIKTRQAAEPSSLVLPYARTDMRKYSFGVRVVEPWNRLDPDHRESATNKAFKNRLKHGKNH